MTIQTLNRIGRTFFMLSIFTVFTTALLAFQAPAHAAICKVQFEDIGTIIGRGTNINTAREDVSEKCFDKKKAKITRNSASLDEDTGLAIIDLCANVRCGS